jgi:hypothetical protein
VARPKPDDHFFKAENEMLAAEYPQITAELKSVSVS